MAKKIAAALRPGGLLYLDTHKVSDDKTQPAPCILGWLSTHLNGLDILQTDRSIVTGVEQAGLENSGMLRNMHLQDIFIRSQKVRKGK